MAEHYLQLGARVYGTYRTHTPEVSRLQSAGIILFPLDINSAQDVYSFALNLKKEKVQWDFVISAPGQLSPIGRFFDLDFEEWQNCVITNSLSQLRILHSIYHQRTVSDIAKVIFFAGGGTNSAFDNYSAYCAGKLLLIKMTELLDSECKDLQVSIIGTGWVNTKIHQQTIVAGASAGDNYDKTLEFLEYDPKEGSTLKNISQCIDWCLGSTRKLVGGRNFSMVDDPWRDSNFLESLQQNSDTYKLRRKK